MKRPVRFEAVLFDLDGTIVDFNFDVDGSKVAMLQELRRIGIDVSGIHVKDWTQTILDKVALKLEGGSLSIEFKEAWKNLDAVLSSVERKGLRDSRLKPDVKKVLKLLKERGRKLALITNSGFEPTWETLTRHCLESCFDVVVTRGDVERLKPSGDGLKKALQKLDTAPRKALYVGDSVLDILAARDAGVAVAALSTGLYDRETLHKSGPDYLLENIEEIVKIVSPNI